MKLIKLSELFNIEICKNSISMDYALENPGNTPYITTTSENNGVECLVNYSPQYKGGVLTVSKDGGNGDAFLQSIPFCGNEKVMVLTPKTTLSIAELFFYATVIRYNKYIFGYGRKCSVARLSELYVPALSDIPAYVKNFEIHPIATGNDNSMLLPSFENWGEYILGDLFEIKKGKRLTSDDQEGGSTPYIGAIDSNNGIANYIGQEAIHDGNTISLSYNGSVGEAFYQPNPFWATDDVNVLYFREENGVAFNKYIALFVCAVLRQEKYRYSYGRKWVLDSMKSTIIKLPEKSGKPDWTFMESYMKSLPYGDRI